MAYEQRDMSGSLFKNSRKTSDKHPDRNGSAMIDGVEYWVSGWVKQDRNGNPWMSLAFKRKDEAQAPAPRQQTRARPSSADMGRDQGAAPRRARDDLDDEIPFLAEFR